MLIRIPFVLVFSLGLVAATLGDDDKKTKLPPMTFVGNVDGELVMVDEGSDRIVVTVRKMVPTQVPGPAYGPGRLYGGGRTVMKEQIVQESYNLSPDVAIRLMNKRPETPPKQDKKKTDTKSAKKENKDKKSDDAKDSDNPDNGGGNKGDKGDKAQGGGPGGGGPGGGASSDPNSRLGGIAGKKSQLNKGQLVRLALARSQDRNNPQNYVIVVYVLADGK
jgi:hypothetical protein